MAKKIVYHFYLKDSKCLKPTSILFSISVENRRKKAGIDELILPKWWDKENERAIESNQQSRNDNAISKRVNKKISRISEELDELLVDYQALDKLTPNHTSGEDTVSSLFEKIVKVIEGKKEQESIEASKARMTPTQFFNEFSVKWSKKVNKRTGSVPHKGTMVNYATTIRRYTDFIRECGLKDSFSLFDDSFVSRFDDFLMNEQELSMNTIVSTHSQLKTMLNQANRDKLLLDTSFNEWPSKPAEITRLYLNDEELKKIFAINFTDEVRLQNNIGQESHIEETRDLFMISARTGLRLSDLHKLNEATWRMEEGRETLIIIAQKTMERLVIPLHKNVIDLYRKYNGKFPTPIDKGKYNEQVRLCAKIAGITDNVQAVDWDKGSKVVIGRKKYELLSSHTGRRSFATNYFIASKSAQLTMALTGHKTEENFRKYVCLDKDAYAEICRRYINLVDAEAKEYKEQADLLLRCIEGNGVIAEEERLSLVSLIKDMQYAWGLGLSFEEYRLAMKHQDDIADEAELEV